ncbi:MAG: glycosyltransferase [Methylococcaceae bacterium]|nr:glycosyltransferase [Methylococcaceae bacterium]MDD1617173.1 glycosyltransferase [Methylococcaceae bacterium]
MIDSEQIIPMLSVELPVHNAEKYIAEAIHSILIQTFTDFELIVIDDGSTDGTLAILQAYQTMDTRIRLVTRGHKGIVATINEGIDLARGKWLARMDADDIALPHRFERQLQWLAKTGADICGGWVQFFGASDSRVLKHPQTDSAIKAELLFMSPFANPTVIMKTALAKQLRYNSAFENAEEYDLWERATRAGWQMTNVPEVLLRYRQHSNQISSRAATQQQVLSQKIRQHAWQHLATVIAIQPAWIDEVIKIREPIFSLPNMDSVDLAFTALLQTTQGEARTIAFDYITQSYLRAAGSDASVVVKWSRLHKKFGNSFAFGHKIKFYLVTVLRLKPNSFWVVYLQKIHSYLYSTHK